MTSKNDLAAIKDAVTKEEPKKAIENVQKFSDHILSEIDKDNVELGRLQKECEKEAGEKKDHPFSGIVQSINAMSAIVAGTDLALEATEEIREDARKASLEVKELDKQQKSLFLQLVGDTPKARILDFLIANKGLSFSKAKISEGAHVFKTAFFKQRQGKHYYNHFGELVRLGIVKAVDVDEQYKKYTLNTESKVAQALLDVDLALINEGLERVKK